MPFGLKNAAQTFQRLMDTVCRGLNTVFVHIDDILVASPKEASHKINLSQLFEHLTDHNLVINLAKCQLGQVPTWPSANLAMCQIGRPSIDFLGHQITPNGATPLPYSVKAFTTLKKLNTIKGLQEFVGMINFYRLLTPNMAKWDDM